MHVSSHIWSLRRFFLGNLCHLSSMGHIWWPLPCGYVLWSTRWHQNQTDFKQPAEFWWVRPSTQKSHYTEGDCSSINAPWACPDPTLPGDCWTTIESTCSNNHLLSLWSRIWNNHIILYCSITRGVFWGRHCLPLLCRFHYRYHCCYNPIVSHATSHATTRFIIASPHHHQNTPPSSMPHTPNPPPLQHLLVIFLLLLVHW